MATEHARPCGVPACPEFAAYRGRCTRHANIDRPKTAERGYDGEWRKLRAMKLNRDPICQIRTHCLGALATTVDHIKPLTVRPDLRLVWSNLQSACKPCNSAKGNR